MRHLYELLDPLLGLSAEPRDVNVAQMSARAIVVFIATLAMLRIAHKRFFATRNALDVLLTLILASTLSRAINGSAPFFPTLVVGLVIVLAHRFLSYLAARVPLIGAMVKGHSRVLIDNGVVDRDALEKHSLSDDDLAEDLRLKGLGSPNQVKRATLERNGEVSVLKS